MLPLFRISYCADDKAEKRFFSFIAKEAEEEKHTCFVFVSDKLVPKDSSLLMDTRPNHKNKGWDFDKN